MTKISYPDYNKYGERNIGGLSNLGGPNITNKLGSATRVSTSGPSAKQYSLAEVQLTNGEMVGLIITATPSLGGYLTKQMASEGYLQLFNDSESLIIKADRVVAIKLTLMTTE